MSNQSDFLFPWKIEADESPFGLSIETALKLENLKKEGGKKPTSVNYENIKRFVEKLERHRQKMKIAIDCPDIYISSHYLFHNPLIKATLIYFGTSIDFYLNQGNFL